MQRGMLFHTLLAPESGGYVEQMVIDLEEAVDAHRFQEAWNAAANRHEVLRAAFRWEGLDDPVQSFAAQVTLPWQEVDLRPLSSSAQNERLENFIKEDRKRGFNLSQPPLMRGTLFRRGELSYRFILTTHHLLFDGRSWRILLKQVFDVYENRIESLEKTAPFTNYLTFLQQRDTAAEREFWRQTLSGFETPNLFAFQTAPRDAHKTTLATAEKSTVIPSETTASLKALADRHGVTLNTIMQATWALLLQCYSGQNDVVYGVTRSCRRSGLEGGDHTVGLFINTLPLRVTLSPTMTWSELLKATRSAWQAMRSFEHAPLEEVQTWSDVSKGTPLFDSIFMFESYQLNEEMRAQGASWQSRRFQLLEQTNNPITLAIYGGDTLLIRLEYDTQRFSEQSIDRVLGHFREVVIATARNPETPLNAVSLLTPAEQRELVTDWAAPVFPIPDGGGYLPLFDEQVSKTPDHIAVESEQGTLTYRQMDDEANRLAHYLRKRGVGSHSRVGVCIERGQRMGVVFLGIWKAGAAYVPLDPAYPKDRLSFMIQDSGMKVLITEAKLQSILPSPDVQHILLDADWAAISAEPSTSLKNELNGQSLAYVIYTSGSTGQPKGVELIHRGLINHNLDAQYKFKLGEKDRVLQICSLSFDISVEEMFPTWLSGATLVPAPRGRVLPDQAFTRFVREKRLTILDFSTAFWHEWVQDLERSGQSVPESVRLVVVGGEKASTAIFDRWQQLTGGRVRWIDTYGPTETTVAVTSFEPGAAGDKVTSEGGKSIGRPLRNTTTYVLDSWGRLAPVGVPGELLLGGACLARGYLNRPDLTAEKFITKTVGSGPAERLYKSGDLVRWRPDGNLEFMGRIDHQVKIRGYRIELGEIETRLMKLDGIQQALVLARQDSPGDLRLVAYLVAESSKRSIPELKASLGQQLPPHMVPSAWVFLDKLPMTPNGKIDVKSLPAPTKEGGSGDEAATPPSDELERQLMVIWEQVLGVKHISRTDNFFDLGGHSLLAVRLFSLIEKRFGRNLPLVTLFEAPTVEQLAGIMRQQGWEPKWGSLVPIKPTGSKPPFYCVHGVGGNILEYLDLANYMDPDQPFYGIQAVGLDGVKPPLESIEAMAAHHITEMRNLQAEGPYHVGGSSFGGLVAYEIAQQLVANGEEVALLAFFDTQGPDYPRFLPGVTQWQNKLNRFKERIELHWDNFRVTETDRKWDYITVKAKRARKILRDTFRRWKADRAAKHQTKANGEPLPEAIRSVGDAAKRAAAAYVPKPYGGPVTLFRATEQPRGIYEDRSLGWAPLIKGELTVYDTPGHHGAIVREPRARILAEQLKDSLRRVNSAKNSAKKILQPQA